MTQEEELRNEFNRQAAIQYGAMPMQGTSMSEYPIDNETQFKNEVGNPALKFDNEKLRLVERDIPYGKFDIVDHQRLMALGDIILRIDAYEKRLRKTTGDPNFSLKTAKQFYFERYARDINLCRGRNGWLLEIIQTQFRKVEQSVGTTVSLPSQQPGKKQSLLRRIVGGGQQ